MRELFSRKIGVRLHGLEQHVLDSAMHDITIPHSLEQTLGRGTGWGYFAKSNFVR